MIETFYSAGALNTIPAYVNAIVIGFALGWCLEQAGFGSSKKNSGFFTLSDMSIIKTLFTAVITVIILLSGLKVLGFVTEINVKLPDTYLWLSILGGLVFAIAYNMSGWTPGAAIVGAVSGKIDALIYIISCCLGFLIYDKTFEYHGFIYENLQNKEQSFVYNLFGFQQLQSLLIISIILLTVLWICELITEEYSVSEVAKKGKILWIFSMFTVISMTYFAFMPSKGRIEHKESKADNIEISQNTKKDNDTYFNKKASESVKLEEMKEAKLLVQINIIEPETLAREKVKGELKIVVVDLRDKEEYEKNNILGSINIETEAIALSLNRFKNFDRIVLTGDEKVTLDVYNNLNNKGYRNIYILEGGIDNFNKKILKPIEERNIKYTDEEKEEILLWQSVFSPNVAVSSFAKPIDIDTLMGK